MVQVFPAIVFVVSDSVGETAEFVVRAAASQFDHNNFEIRRMSYVDSSEAIKEIISAAKEVGGFIAYTLILPSLRETLRRSRKLGRSGRGYYGTNDECF